MNTDNNISIKEDLITIAKESTKFALIAITLFFGVGAPLLYLFMKFTNIDMEIGATLTGAVVAILIVVVDMKKTHTRDKVVGCNRRIIRKVLNI
jgi:hypothetical protein